MSVEAGEKTGPAKAGTEHPRTDAQPGTLLAAAARLFAASRLLAVSLAGLLAAEARLLKASAGVVFLAGIALVAVAVSLWACVVALIGWGLAAATGSVGIALALLVVLHLILVVALWLAIKRGIRQASFPQTRSEFGALRRSLRRDLTKFTQASSSSPSEQDPPQP